MELGYPPHGVPAHPAPPATGETERLPVAASTVVGAHVQPSEEVEDHPAGKEALSNPSLRTTVSPWTPSVAGATTEPGIELPVVSPPSGSEIVFAETIFSTSYCISVGLWGQTSPTHRSSPMHTTALGTLTVLPSDEAPDSFRRPLVGLTHMAGRTDLQSTKLLVRVQISWFANFVFAVVI